MHRRRRIVLVVFALLALALVAACAPAPPPSSPAGADAVERHNYLRGLNGIGSLAVDGGLQANAQLHADRLAAGAATCTGRLWHSSEMGAWYPGVLSAENVACVPGCPDNAEMAIGLWARSAPHAANMFNAAYSHIGVATQCNGTLQIVVAHYRSG